MGFFPFLLGASLAAAPLAQAERAAPAPVPAHPALWVVNDKDTIIYLFGTFHALDGQSDWFEQAVRTAFTASDQLVLETVVPKRAVLARASAGPGQKPVAGAPMPVAQLAPSASFLATTKLVMTAGRSKGLSTDRGADAVLRDAAEQSGKPVAGLESFGFQLTMFSSLPPSASQAPAQDAQTLSALAQVLTQLQRAWNRGEIDATFAPLLKQMQAQSPQTYKTMFVERNARWANWIANRLKTPGTVFVAVGAGHLAGPDSVQNQLGTLGVKSARIN